MVATWKDLQIKTFNCGATGGGAFLTKPMKPSAFYLEKVHWLKDACDKRTSARNHVINPIITTCLSTKSVVVFKPKILWLIREEARHRPRDNGTTGQRDNGTPGQRDNGTTGHRANGTTGHRANGTPGQRDNGTPGNGQANRESQRDNDQEQEKLQGKHAWDQQARQPSNKTRRRMARERRRACYSVE